LEKPDTINVIENSDQIQRDIIKTHLYYLQNINVLNAGERGYFYNEYFPMVRDLISEPLIPMDYGEIKPESVKAFSGDGYKVGTDGEN
jgi:hypothetical protein